MRKLPKIINREDYEKIIKATMKSKHKRKKEYLLAIILAAEAGLRISEIVGYDGKNKIPKLTKDKVDLQAHTIRIESGKGQKDRIVPCPKKVTERAFRLLPLKINRRPLQAFITNLGHKILDKHITFHTLRHFFGSQCAEKMPLHQLQMLMGHSRLDTTGIYLHANPKQAVEAAREVF